MWREQAVTDQVPQAPLPLLVTGTTLRHVLAARIALAIKESPQAPPSGEVGFKSVADPVLYRHPRFNGRLPEALSVLEQRWYEAGAGINSVKVSPAVSTGVLGAFGFIKE